MIDLLARIVARATPIIHEKWPIRHEEERGEMAEASSATTNIEPRKIAIFRALYLGDLLLAVPALRAIRARFPRAEITLIGLPWAETFAQRFSSYIDRFVEFVGYPGIAEVEIEPEREQRFLTEQRAYGYDLVIQMHGSGSTSNDFTLALNGRMTVGYYEDTPILEAGRPLRDVVSPGDRAPLHSPITPAPTGTKPTRGLTLGLPYPEDMPEVERNLGLVKLLVNYPQTDRRTGEYLKPPLTPTNGDHSTRETPNRSSGFALGRDYSLITSLPHYLSPGEGARRGCPERVPREGAGPYDPSLEFPLLPADRVEAAKLLLKLPRGGPWIGLHAGAKAPARRWPAAYFARVADYFVRHFNAQIILTGSAHEEATIRAVTERMQTRPYNVAGQTSLGGLAGLISELDLFISNDTGPAHIANALNTPSVTIFGPVDPQRWASTDQARHPIVRRAVPCSPCDHWECPIDHRCLRWISPDEVVNVARQLLTIPPRGTR